MAGVVLEAQSAQLCALFNKAHGDSGDYEYALDAANSAVTHLPALRGGTVCHFPTDPRRRKARNARACRTVVPVSIAARRQFSRAS